MFAGLSMGTFVCSIVYGPVNVIGIFSISVIIIFLALLALIFLLPESISQVSNETCATKISEFFCWERFKDLFVTVFERREKYNRAIIWLIMISVSLQVAVMQGDGNFTYLYLREMFEWNMEKYNQYCTIATVATVIVSATVTIILDKVKKF